MSRGFRTWRSAPSELTHPAQQMLQYFPQGAATANRTGERIRHVLAVIAVVEVSQGLLLLAPRHVRGFRFHMRGGGMGRKHIPGPDDTEARGRIRDLPTSRCH